MKKVEYTQGCCDDGAAILANGKMLTIEQILEELRLCERLKKLLIMQILEDENFCKKLEILEKAQIS